MRDIKVMLWIVIDTFITLCHNIVENIFIKAVVYFTTIVYINQFSPQVADIMIILYLGFVAKEVSEVANKK